MHHRTDVTIEAKPVGNSKTLKLLGARINGDRAFYVAKVDPRDPDKRAEFVANCMKKKPRLDRKMIEEQMDYIAADSLVDDDAPDDAKISQGQRVAQLAAGVELFNFNGVCYATIEVFDREGHKHGETHPIASDNIREWLASRYYREFKTPATAAAIADAITVLTGVAKFERHSQTVAIRHAEHGGCVYIDLADDAWRCVRISRDGWKIIDDPPIKFVRKRGMKPLPTPTRGGSIADMRDCFNFKDDKQWILAVSWLVGALHPTGGYPPLIVSGPPGSAKSTASGMLRALIDPNQAPLRSPPRDERELFIQAQNSHVCGFDNLSSIPLWMSDALCRIATGGAFSTRLLHSNDSEVLFDLKKPIILNGIEEDSSKTDLHNRALRIRMAEISEDDRETDEDIWAKFNDVAPGVIGAIYDAVACALANREQIKKLSFKPRMLDFAKFIVAAEPKLPWKAGEYEAAHRGNHTDASHLAMEDSPIGPAILSLLENCPVGWRGSMTDLLERMVFYADEKTQRRKDWPDSVPKLSARLSRFVPVLKDVGINVEFLRSNSGRSLAITKIKNIAESASCASPRHAPEPPDVPF